MENTPYLDSPPSSRSSSPTRHTRSPSPSSHPSSTIKPLPPTPQQPPVYEPYRDDPSSPYRDNHQTTPHDDPSPTYHQHPYPNSTPSPAAAADENIPLALLLPSSPYPPTSPPPYSLAIHQTLVQYTRNAHATYHPHPAYASHDAPMFPPQRRRDVLVEIDPESGEVVARTDDVRHGVEKAVAMFVVALVLLFVSGFLGFIAFSS